jgi:hypothetical protein
VARRRLRDAQLQAGDLTVSLPVAPTVVKDVSSSQPARQLSSAPIDTASTDEEVATENPFDTLVQASAVHFLPTRELEQIGRAGIKIRLPRGQVTTIKSIRFDLLTGIEMLHHWYLRSVGKIRNRLHIWGYSWSFYCCSSDLRT